MITLKEVKKDYNLAKQKLRVLDIVKLDFAAGSQTALIGPSGSGKTTVLQLIAGIILPTQGQVIVNEVEINRLNESARDNYRGQKIGYIAQDFNLMSNLTALENVMLAIYLSKKDSKSEQQRKAKELLRLVGLTKRAKHLPKQLSKGEAQRVAIARALANQTDIILADEPTGNLDYQTGKELMGLLRTICQENEITLIVATHDRELFANFNNIVDLLEINQALAKELL